MRAPLLRTMQEVHRRADRWNPPVREPAV